jgi:hypothetical protein
MVLEWKKTIDQFLCLVQDQSTTMIPFEQTGLHRIRRASADAERACQFQTLVIVQPSQQNKRNRLLQIKEMSDQLGAFNTYAIMLVCTLEESGIVLQFSFDENVIGHEQVWSIAYQLERVLGQLCAEDLKSKELAEVETISEQDKENIWTWNAVVPDRVDGCVHQIIADRVRERPNAPAVCATSCPEAGRNDVFRMPRIESGTARIDRPSNSSLRLTNLCLPLSIFRITRLFGPSPDLLVVILLHAVPRTHSPQSL